MKSKNRSSTQMVLSNRIITTVMGMAALVLTATVCILSCSKPDSAEKAVATKGANLKVNGAQPLPGGRAYFTSAIGHFQTSTSQACWVRIVNYTFTAATGTVTADLSIWSSANQYGKTLISSHSCTVDGPAKTCSQYSPTGWIVGTSTNPVVHWSGTYTYNSTTGALLIDWPTVGSGAWENWTVANYPGKALSKLTYVSSSGTYGITHGYGFGSSKPFSYYYSINSVPRVDISGFVTSCAWDGIDPNYTVGGSPTPTAQTYLFSNMTGFGGNAIHYKGPQSVNSCGGAARTSCAVPSNGKTGLIYHLTGLGNSRQMAFNHVCACIPSIAQYPCYDGTIHPYAMMQVIDDNGVMQGLVGIHEQDQPGSAGFSYAINYWLYP